MANYNVGDIIRLNRKANGLSQEELSFDICSVETLSRIENGKHNVKKETYCRLMEKMNCCTEKNYAICTTKDMELLEERHNLEYAILKYDYITAEKYLNKIKGKVLENVVNKQYIQYFEAIIDYKNKKITEEVIVEKIENALKITIDNYEKYMDSIYPYREQELLLLMGIASFYYKMEKYEKSESIYKMLLRCLDNGYIVGKNVYNLRIIILRNYGKLLQDMKKYEKSVKIHEIVMKEAIEHDYGYIIPIALNGIVWSKIKMYENGDVSINLEELKKLKRQAYYIAAARNDFNSKEVIKKSFELKYEEEIEIV